MAYLAGVGVRDNSGLELLLLAGDLTISLRDALVAGVLVVVEEEPPNARPNPVNPPYLGLPSLLLLSSNLVATGFDSARLELSTFASFGDTLSCSTIVAGVVVLLSSTLITADLMSLAACVPSLSEL